MDKFVQKKPKLGDGNLLKIERGDKLKEIAGLSAADYDLKWSERPNEIKMLQPRPGIINESAQVVFTREGRVVKYYLMKGSNPMLGRTWATSAARPVSKMQPLVYTASLR